MILLFSLLLLSGCYLANGSPPSFRFWIAPEGISEEQEKKYRMIVIKKLITC